MSPPPSQRTFSNRALPLPFSVRTVLLLLVLVLGSAGAPRAQTATAEHTVTVAVAPVRLVMLDPLPPLTAGPGPRHTVTTTYALATNRPAPQSLVVSIDKPAPTGVSVAVSMEPPAGAQASQEAPLQVLRPDGAVTPRTVVTGIGPVSATGLTVSVHTTIEVEAAPGDAPVRLLVTLVD